MSFQEAYEQYFEYVWRLLRRLGIPERDAEDTTQEVFLRLHRQFEKYDAQRSMKAWLGGIAYNVASEHRKKSSNKNELLAVDQMPDTATPAGIDNRSEARQLVERALSCLSEEQREVVVLYHLLDHTMKEVSEITKVNENTCGSRLREANKKITQLLGQQREGRADVSR